MAANKPVIHGRDHMPGGADPIPAVAAVVGDAPWCRIRRLAAPADQIIASASETRVRFNDTQSSDPTGIFTGIASNSLLFDGIIVNQDGLYSIRSRVYWQNAPTTVAQLMMNGIDSDGWYGYSGGGYLGSGLLFNAMTFSSLARLPSGKKIYATVLQASGTAVSIDADGGTFLELQYIAPSDVSFLGGGV